MDRISRRALVQGSVAAILASALPAAVRARPSYEEEINTFECLEDWPLVADDEFAELREAPSGRRFLFANGPDWRANLSRTSLRERLLPEDINDYCRGKVDVLDI